MVSEAASGAWDNWVPEACWGLAVWGTFALSRALLTKALALDAAVGGGAVPGCPELEASSGEVEALLLTLACRNYQHVHNLSQLQHSFFKLAPVMLLEISGCTQNEWGWGWGMFGGGAFDDIEV